MDPEARIPHAIAGEQIVIRVGQVHPVAFIVNRVVDYAIALRLPKMNPVPARGAGAVRSAQDFVPLDRTISNTSHKDAESIAFDSTISNRGARTLEDDSRIESGEIPAKVPNRDACNSRVGSSDGDGSAYAARVNNRRVGSN
jgi:hypothetical protein